MRYYFNKDFSGLRASVLSSIRQFDQTGEILGSPVRNTIKIFDCNGQKINVKSFKLPNAVNKVAYRFFRKSKAQRSFEYAQQLLSRDIGTPRPVAYAEEKEGMFFGKSFYVSEQLSCDLTYRTLVQQPDFPQWETILRAFTRFTYELHEKGVEFLDHSPGNTLIRCQEDQYEFFLVDLNRMKFRELSFDERMKNFSRLTPQKEMVAIMASEYARLYQRPEPEVFAKMWEYTERFQQNLFKKRKLKKKLKFWKR